VAPGAIAAALVLIRTAREDRTLRTELPGYDAYARRVRFRVLPGVW
jgi:protein-S-isoprenylcysteine O-methyltransferase Ste14